MRLFFLTTILFFSNIALTQTIDMNLNFTDSPILDFETNLHSTTIDGRIISEKEAIWTQSVLLVLQSKEKYAGSCSGTIIAKDTILTAAHCVTSNIDSVKIIFGYNPKSKQHLKTAISNAILPFKMRNGTNAMPVPNQTKENKNPYLEYDKDWHLQFENYFNSLEKLDFRTQYDDGFSEYQLTDIALIFFKGGLPKGYSPAEFYHGIIPDLKENIYSYGYGIDSRDLNKAQSFLRESKGKVFAYYANPEEKPIFLLAYSGGESGNVCAGDSGGGTYFKNKTDQKFKLIAINNTSANQCANSNGHLFVYRFIPWIEESIKEYRSKIEI